jgi:hypothetical protein
MAFQAASLSVLVPRDCCASHRPATPAPDCHQEVRPAPHCPMPAADGTPCPMHAMPANSDARRDCVLRGSCDGPLSTLSVLLPAQGILAEPTPCLPDLSAAGGVDVPAETACDHTRPPDSPPPHA